jgi:hypothetical protein
MESAWVRIASSVRAFVNDTLAKVCTLEAMRTQALSGEDSKKKGIIVL